MGGKLVFLILNYYFNSKYKYFLITGPAHPNTPEHLVSPFCFICGNDNEVNKDEESVGDVDWVSILLNIPYKNYILDIF